MKNKNGIFVALFIMALGAFGCTKSEKGAPRSCENKLTEQDALQEFAVMLSKAVVENEEMRVFLKEEALKEFDRDNDVFYPYVKNHVFSSGKTFQQELTAHEEYVNQLNEIERAVPKLTILVPDFAWVDPNCFSVRNWDIASENLCVGYDDRNDEHSLFYNGELMGKLSATEFPSFPVLIVKSNERMCVTTTKSGETEFAFIDPAFDGSADATKGHVEEYYYNPTPDADVYSKTGNSISHEELELISPELIEANNEFPAYEGPGVQRDYIYYGMTKQNTSNGVLNKNMRDLLYRFRLTPEAIYFVSDDIASVKPDPKLSEVLNTGRGDRPGFEAALPRLMSKWGDGRYELRLEFFQGYPNNGTASVAAYPISVAPAELFYVTKCFRTFTWNFWGNNWSTYSISIDDIESKWYYPGDKDNPIHTSGTTWNLFAATDNLFLHVFEFDPSGTTTKSKECTNKESSSVKMDASGEYKKINLGVSGTQSTENSWKDSYSYTITDTSDDLLNCEINYIDNYIIATTNNNGKKEYQLKDFGNEYFAVSFLPVDKRKEYQIRQTLLARKSRIK